MLSSFALPRAPDWTWPDLPGDVISVPVAQLRPLDMLEVFVRDVGSAEPSQDELMQLLRAGEQPYAVEVAGNTVIGGWGVVQAARAAGITTVAVRACPGCEGLNTADLGLRAAGWHRRIALAGRPADPFADRILAALLYHTWATHMKRRRPSGVLTAEKRKRMELRQRTIRESLGRVQRTLARDVSLLFIVPELRDAVRLGRLPGRALAPAEKLPASTQKRLAKELAKRPFAALEAEFFGPVAERAKTRRGAAGAIRKSIHALVREARDRADCFALRAEEYAVVREAISLLTEWATVPPPKTTPADMAAELAAEVGTRRRSKGR